MVVGIDVGSGYDVNARLLARHLVNHIPGNPSIVVQNQPGAGSANMTAQVYANGPFDGTVIGAAFAGLPTYPLFTPAAASRFDLTKLNWLGNTNRETHVTYVWHTSPVQSFDELRTTELIMGAQAPAPRRSISRWSPMRCSTSSTRSSPATARPPRSTSRWSRARCDGAIAALTSVRTLSSQWLAEKKIKIITQWALRTEPRPARRAECARSRQDRRRARRDAAHHGAARRRAAVLPAAERAGRPRRGAARGVRRHHEGPGLSRRGRRSSRSTSIR